MKNRLSFRKGADITKNILQNRTGVKGILPHTVGPVSIGADGDDLTAQFLEPPEIIRGGQEAAAAVHAAGVHLQALSLGYQYPENFIHDLPMGFIGNGPGGGMAGSFGDVGQMGQYIKIIMDLAVEKKVSRAVLSI